MKPEVFSSNQAWEWNAIARRHVERHPRIGYLPFYNATAQLWNLHEEIACGLENSGANCCDCTHFCYTPQFWGHFYNDVYELLRTHRHRAHHHHNPKVHDDSKDGPGGHPHGHTHGHPHGAPVRKTPMMFVKDRH